VTLEKSGALSRVEMPFGKKHDHQVINMITKLVYDHINHLGCTFQQAATSSNAFLNLDIIEVLDVLVAIDDTMSLDLRLPLSTLELVNFDLDVARLPTQWVCSKVYERSNAYTALPLGQPILVNG